MPKDHCARAAHPCLGQFPSSAAGEQLPVLQHAPDREWPATTLKPEFTADSLPWPHRQEWLTPVRLAGRPPSQTCGTSGLEPAVWHAPGIRGGAGSSASGPREPRSETRTMGFTSAAPAASPRDIPRLLQNVHVLHTGESDAGRAGSFWLLGEATAELPDPKVTTISQTGRGRNTSIASIAVDRTSGPLMPVQCGGNQPTPLRPTRVGT